MHWPTMGHVSNFEAFKKITVGRCLWWGLHKFGVPIKMISLSGLPIVQRIQAWFALFEIEIENENWKQGKCPVSGEREGESAHRHCPLLPGSAACCTPSGCILANLPALH